MSHDCPCRADCPSHRAEVGSGLGRRGLTLFGDSGHLPGCANRPFPADTPVAPLSYALVSAVPENWIPLVPVRESSTGRIHLRRAAMAVTGAGPPHARGAIIGAPGPLIVADEEIPRSGVTLTRAFHFARWIDGSTYLWVGREKEAGQGEASSGLQFDTARKAGVAQ